MAEELKIQIARALLKELETFGEETQEDPTAQAGAEAIMDYPEKYLERLATVAIGVMNAVPEAIAPQDTSTDFKKLFEACQEARDAAGYISTVPECIADLSAENRKLRKVIQDNWQGDYWRAVNHNHADEVRDALGIKPKDKEPEEMVPSGVIIEEYDITYRPKPSSGMLYTPPRGRRQCVDCGRLIAENADDAANGDCPKHWAINDQMAEDDCKNYSSGKYHK